jgi:Rrf2 family cysteine metabolism transcriptional repressor
MKISAKSEYACLAMLALARAGRDDPPVRIRDISGGNDIPERYLVQILLHLKAAGLVTSTRGASGGYRLARPAAAISLGEVLTAIEGPEAAAKPSARPAARALAAVWANARAAERAVLDTTSIAQVASLNAPHEWVI